MSSADEIGTGDVADGTGTYAVVVTLTNGQSSKLGPATRLTYFATKGSAKGLPTVDGVGIPGGNDAGGQAVTVYGSGFSAGTGTPSVTFGGVTGSGVKVISDSELTVTVPAYSAKSTVCATKLDPATNVCQVEIQVRNSNGVSAESKILPEYTGPAVGGSGEELPAPTEFDYFPTPKITSISVSGGLASEQGGSIATVTGVGFGGDLGLDWVNVGPYQDLTSQDYSVEYFSGTKMQLALPAEPPTTSDLSLPVTVQTEGSPNNQDLAGRAPSNSAPVTYAPTPVVSSIEVFRNGSVAKYDAGPSTGGTKLVVNGTGLQDTSSVQFTDVGPTGATYGFSTKTAFTLTKVTATSVTLTTPGDQPGIDQVSACGVSGCSAPLASGDTFTYYPLGTPRVSSVSPARGKAGTKVTIDGANLGFIEAVYFGKVKATTFANVPALLDCGSTTQVTAVAPPGTAGSTVEIRVVTLESEVTGTGKSAPTPKATFTYNPARADRHSTALINLSRKRHWEVLGPYI